MKNTFSKIGGWFKAGSSMMKYVCCVAFFVFLYFFVLNLYGIRVLNKCNKDRNYIIENAYYQVCGKKGYETECQNVLKLISQYQCGNLYASLTK